MADIFVFGSNIQGIHGKGAALTARKEYGAVIGVGRGRTGNAYAIPTKSSPYKTLPLDQIEIAVADFAKYVVENPENNYFVASPGCGLAGYCANQIAPMFLGMHHYNVDYADQDWHRISHYGPYRFQSSRWGGYEVSSKGDQRFSAFYARMPDGRTIEQHYQCDVKGYDIGGTNWKLGKGNPPLKDDVDLWREYLSLWEVWAENNKPLMRELWYSAKDNRMVLSDMFSAGPVNQAAALAEILNRYCKL